jgi:AcrR family transcriptional regulator
MEIVSKQCLVRQWCSGNQGRSDTLGGVHASTESRRDRQRRELVAEIIAVACRQLDEGGPANVSWRGVARVVGMHPASLYTYYASLDDLFTALITENFRDLAGAVSQAFDDSEAAEPVDRLLACVRAYRAWAVASPRRFNLIWTDQLPGYAAPPGGPTVTAEQAVYRPFLLALGEAEGRGDQLAEFATLLPDDQRRLLGLFGTLHGLVSLEINSHLAPGSIDGEALIVDQMTHALRHLHPARHRPSATPPEQ